MRSSIYFVFVSSALAIISSVFSCNDPLAGSKKDPLGQSEMRDDKVLSLLQSFCFNCHAEDRQQGKRIAPPMSMVREHYLYNYKDKDAFADAIIKFMNNPTEESSLMPGAVRNFGLMPKQNYNEKDLRSISEYIYENDFLSDQWQKEWEEFKKNYKPSLTDLNYEEMGQSFANGTKAQLGKNLLAAINEYGTAGAVEFCNTRAIALTDSMATVFNAGIKRVSDKPRNPSNRANEMEAEYIAQLKNKIEKGEKLIPEVFEHNGKMIGYYSIETNKMCLQCHGEKNKNVLPETLAILNKLYPDDQATGYTENQVRGIWVVTMNKK